jgi:hypothetical protein
MMWYMTFMDSILKYVYNDMLHYLFAIAFQLVMVGWLVLFTLWHKLKAFKTNFAYSCMLLFGVTMLLQLCIENIVYDTSKKHN